MGYFSTLIYCFRALKKLKLDKLQNNTGVWNFIIKHNLVPICLKYNEQTSTIISLYFLKYGKLHTKFCSEFSLCHYALKHGHRNWIFFFTYYSMIATQWACAPLGLAPCLRNPGYPWTVFVFCRSNVRSSAHLCSPHHRHRRPHCISREAHKDTSHSDRRCTTRNTHSSSYRSTSLRSDTDRATTNQTSLSKSLIFFKSMSW